MTAFRPEARPGFSCTLHIVMIDDGVRVVEKRLVGFLKIAHGRTASAAQLQTIAEKELSTGRCELLRQEECGISSLGSFVSDLNRSL